MRMTSYSIGNRPEDDPVITSSSAGTSSSTKLKPLLLRREPTKAATPSRIISEVSENATGASDTCFAAFKVLPVEPARVRSGSRTRYAEPADDLAEATTCDQVVDLMVNAIRGACEDKGSPPVVMDRDVVRWAAHRVFFNPDNSFEISLAEAQKMTSIYAKMEYGMKRLLWLGALV